MTVFNKRKRRQQQTRLVMISIAIALIVVLMIARESSVATPDIWAEVEPFMGLEHNDCDVPCVLGLSIGETSLEEATQLLTEQNIRHEVRPTHMGGAGVYALFYDWDNPMQIRIYDFVLSHNEIRFNEDNIVETAFLSGGVICPINFIAMYDAPARVVEDEHGGLNVSYPDLGMGYRYQKNINSTEIWLWQTDPASLETETAVIWTSDLIALVEDYSAAC